MMGMERASWLGAILVMIWGGLLSAQEVPATLRYQARVLDGSGEPVDQVVDAVFRLYASAEGGVALWSEEHTVANGSLDPVTVDQGLFSVVLGKEVPLDAAALGGSGDLYLGLTLGGDGELSPRLELSGLPFAQRAGAADDVPGADITPNSITVNGQPVVDATGAWVGLGSTSVAFRARYDSTGNIGISANTDTPFIPPFEEFDLSGDYDVSTGVFTAPAAGVYSFSASALWTSGAGDSQFEVRVNKNGVLQAYDASIAKNPGSFTPSTLVTTILQLAPLDEVSFSVWRNGASSVELVTGLTPTWVSGHKID